MWTCCFAHETSFGVNRTNEPHLDNNLHDEKSNLSKYSLEEIFSSNFWKSAEQNIKSGNWYVCYDNCGIKSDRWKDKFTNWEKIQIG